LFTYFIVYICVFLWVGVIYEARSNHSRPCIIMHNYKNFIIILGPTAKTVITIENYAL